MRKRKSISATNNSLVYVYCNYEQKTPFYVGKGVQGRELDTNPSRRSEFFMRKLAKVKDVKICTIEGLTENEAFAIEKELIKSIGRRNLGTGSLVNLTDGGEGISGSVFSEERKRKIGLQHKGKIVSIETRKKQSISAKKRNDEHRQKLPLLRKGKRPWNKGLKLPRLSAETRGKISKSNLKNYREHPERCQKTSERMKAHPVSEETRIKISAKLKGRKHTEEAKRKMSISNKGRVSNRKGVKLSEETIRKIKETKRRDKQNHA